MYTLAITKQDKDKNLAIIRNKSLIWSDNIITATGKVFGMLSSLYKTYLYTPQNFRFYWEKLIYCLLYYMA